MQPQLWTLNGLSVELDVDRRTLARRLEGLEPDDEADAGAGRVSRRYRMAAVFRHLAGAEGALDPSQERARRDKEAADKLSMENAQRRGELGELALWEQALAQTFGELRSAFLAFPTKLAPLLDGEVHQRKAILDREVYDLLVRLSINDNRPEDGMKPLGPVTPAS